MSDDPQWKTPSLAQLHFRNRPLPHAGAHQSCNRNLGQIVSSSSIRRPSAGMMGKVADALTVESKGLKDLKLSNGGVGA